MDISITLTGAQIVGFVTFLFTIGPAVFLLGRLWQRVMHLEVAIAKDREDAGIHREALWEEFRYVREKLDDVWKHVRGVRIPPSES